MRVLAKSCQELPVDLEPAGSATTGPGMGMKDDDSDGQDALAPESSDAETLAQERANLDWSDS